MSQNREYFKPKWFLNMFGVVGVFMYLQVLDHEKP